MLTSDLLKEFREDDFDLTDPKIKSALDKYGKETGLGKAEDVIAHLYTLDPANDRENVARFFGTLKEAVNGQTFNTVFGEQIQMALLSSLEHLEKNARKRFVDSFSYDEDYYCYRLILHLQEIKRAITLASATWASEELTVKDPVTVKQTDVSAEQVIVEENPTPTVEDAQPKEAKKGFLSRLQKRR